MPSKSGDPADFLELICLISGTLLDGFSFTLKLSSSSSNVTHPFGCTFFTMTDLPGKQKVFSDAFTENTGLLVLQLRGFREGKGLQVARPSSKGEVISDSCVSVLNGFPALGVLSVNGFVQFSPVINGFGELRLCSCDVLKVGIGGIAGMQFKVFKISAFLCVAEGNCINSFWFKAGTGDVRTDVCIFDTSSLNDKSSKGSLFNCVSSLVPYAPFVLICCCEGADSEGKL